MKIKIDRQLGVLAALKERVRDQVVEMQRLEVRSWNTEAGRHTSGVTPAAEIFHSGLRKQRKGS